MKPMKNKKGKSHIGPSRLLCDSDCNNCPIIGHKNSRLLTKILNEAVDKFGDEFYSIVQNNCPNMTVCYDCKIDDFTHLEGCEIVGEKNRHIGALSGQRLYRLVKAIVKQFEASK